MNKINLIEMKIITKIISFLIIIIMTGLSHSQSINSITISSREVVQFDKLLSLSSKIPLVNSNNKISTNKNIYVQQIGYKNSVITNVKSSRSNINLTQIGSKNDIALNISAISIEENVLQIGKNNNFVNLSKANNLQLTTVIQKGQNQNLIMIGSNSISNKLIVTMKGQNQTIFIRNLKVKK